MGISLLVIRMKTPLFIGVDIGSSAIKALVVRADGTLLASARRPHSINHPEVDRAEMNAETDWWGGTTAVIQEVLNHPEVNPKLIAGVGICSIGASFVPVNSNGVALRPGILYGIDNRASAQISQFNAEFGDDFLLKKNGRRLSSQSVGPKIAWLREIEPEIWARTTQLLPPSAFIGFRLSGVAAIDLHTALSFDPLFNTNEMCWDKEMCNRIIGASALSLLPAVVLANDCIGNVSKWASETTGLPEGTPIACGTADVVAEAVGIGIWAEGDVLVMYGSTLFLLERVSQFRPSPPLWPSFLLNKNQPTLLAGASNGGSLLVWYLREFVVESDLESLLDQASLISPGSDGLLCLPYFSGERAPIFDPNARGVFIGLTTKHTRVHMLRALLEGIAFSFRHMLETLSEGSDHLKNKRLIGSGGGIRTHLWMQIMSDVSGQIQHFPKVPEGAALGAAFLGGQASGYFACHDSIPSSWTGAFHQIAPNADRHDLYNQIYPIFLNAYNANAELMHDLSKFNQK